MIRKSLILTMMTVLLQAGFVKASEPKEGEVFNFQLNEGKGDVIRSTTDPDQRGKILGDYKWIKDASGEGVQFNGETTKMFFKLPKAIHLKESELNFQIEITLLSVSTRRVQSVFKSGRFAIEIRANGSVWVNFFNGDKITTLKGTKFIQDKKAHQIRFVRDSKEKIFALYIDGELDAKMDCLPQKSYSFTAVIFIGCETPGEMPTFAKRKEEIFKGNIYGLKLTK